MNSRTISFAAVVVPVLLAASAVADVPAGGFESVDLGRLTALAGELRADVAKSAAAGAVVKVRVQTKGVADPTAARCGFAFLVNDDAGLSSHVPRLEQATCSASGGGPRIDQRVQFVRPGATYESAVTLTTSADNVTFTSNGGDGLEIDTLCVGFRSGDGGAQAFCVDRRLLSACFSSVKDYTEVLGSVDGGIRLSRAFAGRAAPRCKEIVFRNLKGLARGFESLTSTVGGVATDVGAEALVCSRISVPRETSPWAYDSTKCYAERKDATETAGEFFYVKMDARHLRDNCTPRG